MITPCILICTLDDETGLCCGCGRSLDEIGGWGGYTDAERAQVMAVLPARLFSLASTEATNRPEGDGQAS